MVHAPSSEKPFVEKGCSLEPRGGAVFCSDYVIPRVTAAITRDSVEELGLAPGIPAVAMVKATSVMVMSPTSS